MSGAGGNISEACAPHGQLSILPELANNVANCNSLPFTQDALVTDGDVQYAIWVSGPDRAPLISARTLPDGPWAAPQALGDVAGDPFDIPTRLDPHNSYAIGVDGLGRVHVAGNHHNEPLRYARSAPGDIRRWNREPMIGSEEESVTYPAFVRLTDGALLFAYRDGRAGLGDVYLNRLAPDGERWERVGMLVGGRRSSESPYLNHIAATADGAVHLSGCFRERSGGAASNRDIWHAASDDGGRTWRSATGEPLSLPLDHDSVPIAVATARRGSGLVNQTGMDVSPDGHPHIAYLRYDAGGATQIAQAWHDGREWRSRDLTRLSHRMETETSIVDASIARPAVACTSDGNVWVVFRAKHDGYGGRASCIQCTPALGELREFPLYTGDLGTWEPTVDTAALRDRDELHLLLTEAPPYSRDDPKLTEVDWAARPIGVLSLDHSDLVAAALRAARA
jgi:BNR repeat-containing family member